jgi:outer membrane protein assembly factor BamB
LNTKRLILFILIPLSALILSACSGRAPSNNWPGLTADAERAYIATGSFIYAVDLQTGEQAWRYPPEKADKRLFYANPVLTSDGQLLIGSTGTEHPFISLDPATRKENWVEPFTKSKGGWVASPLVLNGTIYAPNADGFLYMIDMNGKEAAAPIQLGGALWSAPSTDGTLLYVTSLDHHLHIIDSSGNELNEPVDLGGAAPSTATVGSDGVYVGSFASTVEFVQSNGQHEAIATTNSWIWGSPVLDSETLYYADLDGKVYSLDVASGSQNWDAVQPDGPIVANLVVANDHVYVATEEGTLVALDRDGNTDWEKTVGGKIYTTPVLSSDLILVAPYRAEFVLAAYDTEGKQAWTFTPEK